MSGNTWRAMWMTHGQPCGDTWQAMCQNAGQRHACVTHGMPCVNMHGSCHAYIRSSHGLLVGQGRAPNQSVEQQGEEEGREGEGGGKEKRNGGKKRRKGGKERRKEIRKEKRKGEEERKNKEEEEGVLRGEQTRTAKNPELRYKR